VDSCTTGIRHLPQELSFSTAAGYSLLFHVYAGDDDPRTRAILILYFARCTGGRLEAGDDAAEARWFPEDEIPSDDKIAFESHRLALRKLRTEHTERFKT
jgi:ADP-ribose pyrophosphatase YjhB (NUDIX family)